MEQHIPTISEVRSNPAPIGRLLYAEWYVSENGMAINSHVVSCLGMYFRQDGSAVLVDRVTRGSGPEERREYRVPSETADALDDLVERENLASWEALVCDPAIEEPIVLDYSRTSSVKLFFDGEVPSGRFSNMHVINTKAAGQQGGDVVLGEFVNLLTSARVPENLLDKDEMLKAIGEDIPQDGFVPGPGLAGMLTPEMIDRMREGDLQATDSAMSADPGEPWTCPECGSENTTRFCPQCGRPRP